MNAIWSRPETKDVLAQHGLVHESLVRLCRTGCTVQGEPGPREDFEVCLDVKRVLHCLEKALWYVYLQL